MSYPALTPTRPLPGTFFQTPAANNISNGQLFQTRTPSAPAAQQESTAASTLQKLSPAAPKVKTETLSTKERAARTINDTLAQEARYPDLDNYLSQGFSSDYEIPVNKAWAPFQRVKSYNIPEQILDQYNRAQISTSMGLFAELNHAWVAIDNALYLWDYTHPNPQLVGYESQSNSINAVKLAKPRPGVFLPSITHILVISTTADIILLGMGCETVAGGAKQVTLYQTGMSTSIRGLDVHVITSSHTSGRIFFAGSSDNDVYEFKYQQEEKWFQGRCSKVNQTSSRIASFAPSLSISFTQRQTEFVEQMIVDDTRNLLYTLSSLSTIRVFHLKPDGTLALAITKPAIDIYSNIGHIIPSNEALNPKVKIVSICPIPTPEASRYHLVATTATGYRIYLSATGSYSWSPTPSGTSPPTSMQAHFVKTPPFDTQPAVPGAMQFQQTATTTKVPIHTLDPTVMAQRFPPGYFFCFTCKDPSQKEDTLFMSAPDSGRIARAHENVVPPKPSESGWWFPLRSRAEDIGLITTPLEAVASANGFGNELAIQYDQTAAELAILTNSGVHVIRRRRLVDIFAALVRDGGGEDGLEGDTKNFIRVYGRSEALATALAVACGQGMEVSDSRLTKVKDPDILEYARKIFIEYGGKPSMNENAVADNSTPAIDSILPSPRHAGIALYMSRLLRSIWKKEIAVAKPSKTGLDVTPSVSIVKLQSIQRDLSALQGFFNVNKNFIEGLSGPEALSRAATKQEETALMAEHRALHSLVQLLSDTIEGISFVLVLFDERVDEIVLALPDEARQRFLKLTFEELFSTGKGHEIAKELVKAIVNRNIAKGSNVETVADALRRRCGNFCSAEDVIIFKAQEQLKRATEAGANSEIGRNLLNESLRLFRQVSEELPMDNLVSAVDSYIANQFFAGAIQLCLNVADSSDKANLALNWVMEGRSEEDSRKIHYYFRKQCYDLIFKVIVAVDKSAANDPGVIDGQYTPLAKRRNEAYSVIADSNDEVFLTCLYDWYLEQGWSDRLLATQSPFVVTYLERKSIDDIFHADLLWRYYAQSERYFDAARVQFQLAQSAFNLPLSRRIEYLGQARANASTFTHEIGRQSRQRLLQEIGNLMDVANIQDDLLQRLKEDDRLDKGSKQEVLKDIDGPIHDLTLLFNRYADAGGYCDICLQIYYAADYRNMTDILSTWENLLEITHQQTVTKGQAQPYEAVIEKIRSLGSRLRMSEIVFPIPSILPIVERYSLQHQRGIGPPTWVVDLFLDLEVPHETIYTTLETMFYNDEAPFTGANKRYIATDLLYIIQRWFNDTLRVGGSVFGSDVMATRISEMLVLVQRNGLPSEYVQMAQELRVQIDNSIR
ncbi:non-repetitive nucleoporin, putative [Talaromyces stipitatus ATCC 10500]|uniref:Non-repetitive nucleoporin, putative n=1 Tax=Talaromyces stipitatus (strain ATCC 10500 / CBS 375.48 / QM 6759 / NRRL 1006) TaxID=441959 RepID=B8M3V9_TALSN|nr:non-repetitive nucleoporin, putative [Talaromyces stipitatus ATCC 10500]EED20702.1 non-repetitive nucleoporin, putative [Talaromyces stipitatus ATCC 10500]